MNIVLLHDDELNRPLATDDRRTRHIINYLRKQSGDRIKAGVVNRSLGWLHITQIDSSGIHYTFEPAADTIPLSYPITVLIGHPRPPATRRLLIDLTALGVTRMVFFCADNSEKSYMHSSLWHPKTITQLLTQGLEFAGATHLPDACIASNLIEGLHAISHTMPHATDSSANTHRWCCITPSDCANSDRPANLHGAVCDSLTQRDSDIRHTTHIILAIGAERGWTANELTTLTAHRFAPCIIGRRTTRTETAAIGAVTAVIAALTDV